jgi:hypothetical protein
MNVHLLIEMTMVAMVAMAMMVGGGDGGAAPED